MNRLRKLGAALGRDRAGLSSVEYALLLAVVAGGIVLAVDQLSDAVGDQMNETADCIDGTRTPFEC
ncbi:MAG: hypothetical protein ACE5GS_11505 [Kiloniellaceae bacterium]